MTAGPCGEFDHYDPAVCADPHASYREMRQSCPVTWSDRHGGFWAVTSRDAVERIVRDQATFSSRLTSVPPAMFGDAYAQWPPITLDPPEHGAFRKLLLPAFVPTVVNRGEEPLREFCRTRLHRFVADGRCDAANDYSRWAPVFMLTRVLGAPIEDLDKITGWVRGLMEQTVHDDPQTVLAAAGELMGYIAGMIAEREESPRDDLVSVMMTTEVDGDRLSSADVMNSVFLFFLAGTDTVWSVLGSVLRHLAENPRDRRRLRGLDTDAMKVAVEEFVRYFAPASLGRVVTQDVEVDGKLLHAGDSVLVCYPAANRDPASFDDAESLVLDRAVNRHLGFGVGPHRCIGANLARLTLRAALEEWLDVIPEFELEDPDGVLNSTGMIWGPRKLGIRVLQAAPVVMGESARR
jgi:cytochrome P450